MSGRLLALAGAFAALPGVYALVRVVQHRLEPEPDPAVVLMSAHSALFTALTVTGYVGASCVIAAFAASRVAPRRLARIVAALAALSAVALAAYVIS